MTIAAHRLALTVVGASLTVACATVGGPMPTTPDAARSRVAVLVRSRLWNPTRIGSLDLKAGPSGSGAMRLHSDVPCTYVPKDVGGRSPKFTCDVGGNDHVKVKFGVDNGEVYGEVLATRLLWALGFGADRMYPVTVICRGCPPSLGGTAVAGGARRFDPAVIERPMAGAEWPKEGVRGWAWNELHLTDRRVGGATRAQRDALTLLAVFIQHTDSKPEQQRILCLGVRAGSSPAACRRPFLMVSDLGLTFGRANLPNANDIGGVNLAAWREAPVWKRDTGCVGNLPRSLTGTLDDPVISEEGRRFLAGLLAQLSDRQLGDLFEVARVERRLRAPGQESSGYPSVAEWVEVFKAKRAAVAARRCVEGGLT